MGAVTQVALFSPVLCNLQIHPMFNQPDHCYFGCAVREGQLWLFKIASSATHLSFDSMNLKDCS